MLKKKKKFSDNVVSNKQYSTKKYQTKMLYRLKASEIKDRQNINSVSRKREARKTKIDIFRSPNSSPTRPIVVVPPIKRKKSSDDYQHKKTKPTIKPFSEETKQLKTAGKIAKPFAVKSSMDTYAINGIFPKPNTFAQKRKIAQVEPFKVFEDDQPLDLTVKKKKVVTENKNVPLSKLNHETGEHLKTRE